MPASKTVNKISDHTIEKCCNEILNIMIVARKRTYSVVNTEMVQAYWHIGQVIVEHDQKGHKHAKYGEYLIKKISQKLSDQMGRGFSISLLKRIRQFYLTYPNGPNGAAQRHIQAIDNAHNSQNMLAGYSKAGPPSYFSENDNNIHWPLSWTHYRTLITLSEAQRSFYEIEAIINNWSSRELDRQVNSFLFERLASSKDKAGLLQLIKEGQLIQKPEDAIKDPLVLEFLGLPDTGKLQESDIETAIIDNLQKFLLELGKGFSFYSRQQRITIDGDNFYTDLVFYHVILKSFLVIDLKPRKLNHADLGQMQLYVNYFDKEVKSAEDNPTIGLVLCANKNDTMVEYFFNKKSEQIFTSRYRLHLPSEEEICERLQHEIDELNYFLKN